MDEQPKRDLNQAKYWATLGLSFLLVFTAHLQVCLITLECRGFPPPSSTAPPSSCLLLQPSSLLWAWPTPLTSTTNSTRPAMGSTQRTAPVRVASVASVTGRAYPPYNAIYVVWCGLTVNIFFLFLSVFKLLVFLQISNVCRKLWS